MVEETATEMQEDMLARLDTEACAYAIKGLALAMENIDLVELMDGNHADGKHVMTALSYSLTVFADRSAAAHGQHLHNEWLRHEAEIRPYIRESIIRILEAAPKKEWMHTVHDLAPRLKFDKVRLAPILDDMLKDGELIRVAQGYGLPRKGARRPS